MKKTKIIILMSASLAFMCSCARTLDETAAGRPDDGSAESVTGQETDALEGSIFCVSPVSTKTSIGTVTEDGRYPVNWMDKDQVKLFGESSPEGKVYQTALEAPAPVASFTPVAEAVLDEERYAIYPASLAGSLSGGSILVDLSVFASQEYHSSLTNFGKFDNYATGLPEGTYEEQKAYYEEHTVFPHLPLFAKAEGGASEFSFSNLFGGIKVSINDYQGNGIKVSSVKLKTDEYVSGTMALATDGSFTLSGDDDSQKSITVFSETGVKISDSTPSLADAGIPFYFFLPAGTYAGLEFEITDTEGRVFRKSTSSTINVTAGDVGSFPCLNLTLFYGKANCCLVNSSSTVTVDVTPRYSFDMTFNGSDVEYSSGVTPPVFKAEVLWDIQRGGTNLSGGVIADDSSVTVSGNVMTVPVNYQGSALIGIKKADAGEDDPVLWSWHIWSIAVPTETDDHSVKDLEYVVGGETFRMMSHNLGATYGSVTNAANAYMTYGMFYQWGRKEPFPAYGTSTYSAGVIALFNSEVRTDATVAMATDNPLTAYKTQAASSSMGVVYPQNVRNNVLWGASPSYSNASTSGIYNKGEGFVKTVYDPCPEGYMIPQAYHFSGLTVSKTARTGYGAILYYDGTNEDYYALPGSFLVTTDVTSGTTKTTSNGAEGRYHTSNPYGTSGWAASYFKAAFSSSISISSSYGAEANMYPVRCMKISE